MAANTPEPASAGGAPSAAPAPAPAPGTSVPAKAAPAATSPAPASAAGPRPPAPPATPQPAPKAPTPPNPGGGNGGLVLLSLLSVLIALGASAVAIYALDQARTATSKANEAFDTANRASAPTKNAPAPAASNATAKASASATRPPTFVAELVRVPLKVPAVSSPCASVYVDVDKMSVGDLNGHEFYLSSCVGPLSLHVDRTSGAVPTTNNPTPELCASQITADTSTRELVMPVINGLTFCLLTNKQDAAQQGLPQRLAIVEVTNVGSDNSLQVAVTTYRVPSP
jgi:hypothetical protein